MIKLETWEAKQHRIRFTCNYSFKLKNAHPATLVQSAYAVFHTPKQSIIDLDICLNIPEQWPYWARDTHLCFVSRRSQSHCRNSGLLLRLSCTAVVFLSTVCLYQPSALLVCYPVLPQESLTPVRSILWVWSDATKLKETASQSYECEPATGSHIYLYLAYRVSSLLSSKYLTLDLFFYIS